MNLRAVIKNAYQALRQNTRRSILTMLGIVIGIASVITILSLGRGFETYTVKNLTATNEKNVAVDVVFRRRIMNSLNQIKCATFLMKT
jgi:putative ABC transport system permease protein